MPTLLTTTALEAQLTARFGPLLTHQQLAALLGRSTAGLRWSLANPCDLRTVALRDCALRVGRRLYYPAGAGATIIESDGTR